MAILDPIELAKNKYLARLRMMAGELYSKELSEQKTQAAKLKGYIEAGVITRLASKRSIERIIEEERTKAGRRSDNKSISSSEKSAENQGSWQQYEQPAYQRKR